MSLADGAIIYQAAIGILATPIAGWDNLDILSIIEAGMFTFIISEAAGRMMHGKGHRTPPVQDFPIQEEHGFTDQDLTDHSQDVNLSLDDVLPDDQMS
jgi:hypothetical protein